MNRVFYEMADSAARRMHRTLGRYRSLLTILERQTTVALRDLSWQYAPFNAWTESATGIRHAIEEWEDGMPDAREYGIVDEIRHGRLGQLLNGEEVTRFLQDVCLKTAALYVH
jgi:hypothetical protein